MKRICAVIISLSILFVMSVFSVVTVRADEKNIALNKPVESSGFIFEDEADTMINDGDINTKWCARPSDYNKDMDDSMQPYEDEGHWIIIDLGKEYSISKYIIYLATNCEMDINDPDRNMQGYKMEISTDKKKWEIIKEEEEMFADTDLALEGQIVEVNFGPKTARYVKLSTLRGAFNDNTVRIPELEVYEAEGGEGVVTAKEETKAKTTNAPAATDPSEKLPKTGDFSVAVPVLGTIVALFAIVLLVVSKERRIFSK